MCESPIAHGALVGSSPVTSSFATSSFAASSPPPPKPWRVEAPPTQGTLSEDPLGCSFEARRGSAPRDLERACVCLYSPAQNLPPARIKEFRHKRGTNTRRGERSYAERREKQREQEIGRRQRRLRTRPRRESKESDESGEETAGERTTRVGRTRGGMKVAARIGEKLLDHILDKRKKKNIDTTRREKRINAKWRFHWRTDWNTRGRGGARHAPTLHEPHKGHAREGALGALGVQSAGRLIGIGLRAREP